MQSDRPFAVVTGASAGIGYELGKCCAAEGYDLLIVADRAEVEFAARDLREFGVNVTWVLEDLAYPAGVDHVLEVIGNRRVDALLANAGHGLGGAFLDQNFDQAMHVLNTNVTGTLRLIYLVGGAMLTHGAGKILVTGSIAGLMPGSFQAVYNGSKAFLDSFCYALREELKDSGISVTCLMPGATDTDFFERAQMLDTKVGSGKKQPAHEVARSGFEAMQRGDAEVVTGFGNKVRAALSHVVPSTLLAEQHRKEAAPGTGR